MDTVRSKQNVQFKKRGKKTLTFSKDRTLVNEISEDGSLVASFS